MYREQGGHFQQMLWNLAVASEIQKKNGRFNQDIFDVFNFLQRAICTPHHIIEERMKKLMKG